jgi:1,4-alpha-glucan branching enzyme
MARDSNDPTNEGFSYWSCFVPNVVAGAQYKFRVQNNGLGPGNRGDLVWRLDPYCADATDLTPTGNSLTVDPTYAWASSFTMPNWNEMVLYELHIGTFNAQPGVIGTFNDALGKLDYLRDLGINAIEIMPANDFDTQTSWGYNPALLFALDSAYATPANPAGVTKVVQQFVDAAHGGGNPQSPGIAVIFDVVYNHLGPQGLDPCMWQFDEWSQNGYGGIYLYNDERASCPWGQMNRPDFGRSEVRQVFRDNAMMWLHQFRADGLRLDSVVNIREVIENDNSNHGDNAEGWQLLQWINNDKNSDQAWKITIAEDLQNSDWITKTTGADGAGFDAQWDPVFRDAIRNAVIVPNDADRDMGSVAAAIGKSYNASGMFQRILYVESHDEASQGRLPNQICWGNATSWFARKRSTLAAGIVMTSPGIPMLFQGQEFLEWLTWSDTQPLDWTKAGTFASIRTLYEDLIKVRRNWYNNTRGLHGASINVFHVNDGAKVIAFHRWADGGAGDDVVVVANLSTLPYASYNIGLPREGTWYLRFNSDWQAYGGDFGNVGYDTTAGPGGNQGMPFSGSVGIGAYSLIILSQ